jgi:glutathione S-transferase
MIYHIALLSDWEQAKSVGSYRVSTRGRMLDDEGFIHASYADQVAGVARTFYRGIDAPLVLLTVDTAKVPSQVIAENTGGGIELFPHVYGPIPADAVVATGLLTLDAAGTIVGGGAP